mgnify:CR=1 FL=1
MLGSSYLLQLLVTLRIKHRGMFCVHVNRVKNIFHLEGKHELQVPVNCKCQLSPDCTTLHRVDSPTAAKHY